ncbi:MAG: undecaprenyl-diphosphate phosphatase [Deltaproteobacteria bacterium]|nr:undecaprenyl-diphosphate phosphatase [Deltaproteobacteria bacterium]MBW2663311.1 undecaprenyl-diphosphate phosphatase [Deltaproteobacteria bacterium]
MDLFQATILGIIQGLTEFLPVSSSGHLVISQHLFGLKEPELFFDISVHVGTLAAIIFFFRKEIISIIVSLAHFIAGLFNKKESFSNIYEDTNVKLAFLIVVGSVPTGILGILFHKIADQLFSSVVIVGFMLLVTGLLLWSTRRIKETSTGIAGFSAKYALIIGLVQGIAIMPGISRSGSTIAVALFLGLGRETAARYSFLLSIPAILGASVLSLADLSSHAVHSYKAATLGAVIAAIVGYCALKLLVYMVKQGSFHIFAPYCMIIGVLALYLGR